MFDRKMKLALLSIACSIQTENYGFLKVSMNNTILQ